MNKADEKTLEESAGKLDDLRDALQDVLQRQQDKYDAMSEKAQEGEKGQDLYETINQLENAVSSIESAIDNLTSISPVS